MLVSDVMSTNVVTIPSHTTLTEARRIFDAHHFRRLPVVDRGRLVGVVTKDALDKIGFLQPGSLSMHDISYLLSNAPVKEVMQRDVVTVTPSTTVEEGVALAQAKRVGALVVVEGEKVVGIATTNDFFYRILNPLLGIRMPGSRITIRNCYKGPDVEKVIAAINKLGVKITALFTFAFELAQKEGVVVHHDLTVHLAIKDSNRVVKEIQKLGYSVEKRAR